MKYTPDEEKSTGLAGPKFCLWFPVMTCVMAVAQGDPPRWLDAATAAQRKPGTKVRIDLIGDSTQTNSAGYAAAFAPICRQQYLGKFDPGLGLRLCFVCIKTLH